MVNGWHIYECDYVATQESTSMHVIDWVWTGAVGLSIDEIGHFWKVKGYSITNASFKEVDNQPQDAAIIEFLSK